MNILVTIHDEETNMASVIGQLEDGRLMVRLFDCDSEQYAMEGTVYPAHMSEQAFRKALSVAIPERPMVPDGLREQWEATQRWIKQMDERITLP